MFLQHQGNLIQALKDDYGFPEGELWKDGIPSDNASPEVRNMIRDAASSVCMKLCGVAEPDAQQWSDGGVDGSYLKTTYDTEGKRQGVLNYFDKAKGKASRSTQTIDT